MAYRNGTSVRHDPDFHPDIDRLLRRLGPVSSSPTSPHAAGDACRAGGAAGHSVGPSLRTSPRPGLAILNGHTQQVSGCAVAPDGTWIVSASLDETLRIWDAATGSDSSHPGRPHRALCRGVRWPRTAPGSCPPPTTTRCGSGMPPPARLVASSKATPARCWGVRCPRTALGSCPPPCDETLRIWDAATGETRRILEGHTEPGVGVCGVRRMAPGSCPPPSMRRCGSGMPPPGRRVAPWKVTPRPCAGVRCPPDGAWIVSASVDKTLRIWDAATGDDSSHPGRPHRGRVRVCGVRRTALGSCPPPTTTRCGSGMPPPAPDSSHPGRPHRDGVGVCGGRRRHLDRVRLRRQHVADLGCRQRTTHRHAVTIPRWSVAEEGEAGRPCLVRGASW